MSSPSMSPPGRVPMNRLSLDFPRSLAVYDTYEDAQRAVDYLSDHEFPVQNVMIVGTELKQVERVTGRLTWGKVVAGGLLSGMWLGLFVGLVMSLFGEPSTYGSFLSALLVGAVFGIVWAAIGYSLTHGKRDFTSISQVVATRYEVLVEHALFDRGRDLLAQLPGARGLAPQTPTAPAAPSRPNPYEGRYGVKVEHPRGAAASHDGGTHPHAPHTPAAAPASAAPNPYEGRYGVRTHPSAAPQAHVDPSTGATAVPPPAAEAGASDAQTHPEHTPRRDDHRPPPPDPRD